MGKQATGELRPLADGWAARITIQGRDRRDFPLAAVANEAEAQERCRALAEIASRLRRAGKSREIVPLLEMGAKARAGRPWECVLAAVDAECSGQIRERAGASTIPTVPKFCDEWTSGRLHERFPDHVGKKKDTSVERDEGIAEKYIKPHLAERRIDEVTLNDCEIVMANVPSTLSPASRRQVAQFLHKLLGYAVYPCRYMAATPIPRGWLPKLGKPKGLQMVRPAEDAKHLANTALPLWRRMFFGLDRREGFRSEELASLRLRDVDLELGAVRLDENKTDVPRAWALSPDVAEALCRYVKAYRKGAEPDDYVLVDEDERRIDTLRLAALQRADLKASGVTRAELHEDGPNRRKLRAHDGRAAFVTEALAHGKSEAWVMDRTGHTTSAMLNRYRRAARNWTELHLGTWTPLHEALPELGEGAMVPAPQAAIAPRIAPESDSGAVAKWSGSGLQSRADQASAPSNAESSADPPSREPETLSSETARGNLGAIPADEATLEDKMIAADLAGQKTLALAYQRKLERLRETKAADNVVSIESAKRKGRP